LTRLRYCFPNGQLDMICKESPAKAPAPLKPWFSLPSQFPEDYAIFFGHWASLEGKFTPEHVYAMDTGCCWGGDLTLLHWETKTFHRQKSHQKRRKE
ncbi:diadenosine tetraphosphatase, partial [Providencia rettgeri]